MSKKDDVRPFSEKHPVINSLIGLAVLFGFVYVILLVLRYVAARIEGLISWLSSVTSGLEAVVVVALITGTVSIVSVVFTSVIAKVIEYRQKRREYLYQKREEPYGDFVEVVYKMLDKIGRNESYSEEEMTADINRFSQKLTLWGSNRVIKKWIKFRTSTIKSQTDPAGILFTMEDILYAMRKDFGLRRMKKGNLLSFFIKDISTITKH